MLSERDFRLYRKEIDQHVRLSVRGSCGQNWNVLLWCDHVLQYYLNEQGERVYTLKVRRVNGLDVS